jgi:hypothetical protein
MHIIVELPWSSDALVQQCGRTHRSGQVVPPEYVVLASDVHGEMRFCSAMAARLRALGALTRGDRRAAHAGSASLAQFDMETPEGQRACRHLQTRILIEAAKEMANQKVDNSCTPEDKLMMQTAMEGTMAETIIAGAWSTVLIADSAGSTEKEKVRKWRCMDVNDQSNSSSNLSPQLILIEGNAGPQFKFNRP